MDISEKQPWYTDEKLETEEMGPVTETIRAETVSKTTHDTHLNNNDTNNTLGISPDLELYLLNEPDLDTILSQITDETNKQESNNHKSTEFNEFATTKTRIDNVIDTATHSMDDTVHFQEHLTRSEDQNKLVT